MSLCLLEKCALTCVIGFLPGAVAFGQSASPGRSISANDLARAVVANELKVQDTNHRRWMFRVDKEEQGKKQAREVIQTGQGSVDQLVALDGHPLNAKQEQNERQRIENLIRNPAEQQRLEQTKRKDAEQCKSFFKMIPDALSFSYAGSDGGVI